MTDWQPINTAPKNGRQILCWNADQEDFTICWWDGDEWMDVSEGPETPTHWMSLPDPPVEAPR